VCLVAPTGAGKTRMAEDIAAGYRNPLMLVPSRAIYAQSADKFNTLTVQSMLDDGRASPFGEPDLVIWDECHHSASDKWSAVRRRWPKARWLGLTATPVRADGRPLDAFEQWVISAEYSELVREGVIVPCELYRPAKHSAKDRVDADPVTQFFKHVPHGVRTLAFCADLSQCADVVRGVGKRAAPYHSEVSASDRRKNLDAFLAGKVDLLVTHDMLTEGFNLPQVVVILLARPCHELGTYLQVAGRGARSCPGKSRFHLIDCSGASLKHGNPIQDWGFSRTEGITAPKALPSGADVERVYEPRILEARLDVTAESPQIARQDLATVHDLMLAAANEKARELIANGADPTLVRRALGITQERLRA
jgi:superfamily II DNA or RNA helicase